jgi:AcrR family transcriptional regulator
MTGKQKEQVNTKSELVEAAWELFAHQGYDKTTVNAIIEKVGVSKGAFYHYFESKEDVLDAVVEHLTEHVLEDLEPVLNDAGMNATHKLDCLLSVFRTWKAESLEMVRDISMVLNRDENIIIRHKVDRRTDEMLLPPLTDIIAQGLEEKTFDIEDAPAAAEMVLVMLHAVREMQMRTIMAMEDTEAAGDILRARIRALARLLERFLGAPAGTVVLVEEETVQRFIEAFG